VSTELMAVALVETVDRQVGDPRKERSNHMADITGRGAEDELLVEVNGGVGVVTLNRPGALNAANETLHGELALIWRELDADPAVRAIVLTGSGKAFCAGGDLDLLDRMVRDTKLRDAIMTEAAEIVRAMTSVRVPIIAAVNGPAVGLGCSLAAMSDLVIVEEQAYFADPHVALGLVAADGGGLTWPLLTSLLRAKEFILLGDRLLAADAVQLGLANRMVPAGTAGTVARELADRMASLPPQALRESKALLNRTLQHAVSSWLAEGVAAETASFDEPAFQANLGRLRGGRS
jgi:enoyl-CoA hydratase